MNKVVNVFSGVIIAIYCIFTMIIVYDLSASSTFSLKALPFKLEIAIGLTFVVFILAVLRMKRRWQGVKDMKRFDNFHYASYITKSVRRLGGIFTIGEAIFSFFVFLFVLVMPADSYPYVLPMMVVLTIIFVDSILFALKMRAGGNAFRLIANDRLVAYFDREMHLFYYTGLKRIEMHQDMINFQYKGDLNLFLPLDVITKKDRKAFREQLIAIMDRREKEKGKSVYMDDAFRTLT